MKSLLSILTAIAVVLGSLQATPAQAAVLAAHTRRAHVVHGTIANRHLQRKIVKPTPKTVRVHVRTHTTRSRRAAHVHRGHRRHGGVGGHVYANAEPVAGAKVSLVGAGRSRSHAKNRHIRALRSVVTDNAGHFVFRGAGAHRLVASKAGVGKATKSVHIKGGHFKAGVKLNLSGKTSHKHKKHRHKK